MTEEKEDYAALYTIAVKSRQEMRQAYRIAREQKMLLEDRLEKAERLLARVNGALNSAFSGGMEEREGGSARRQERYMKEPEALANEISTFLGDLECVRRS